MVWSIEETIDWLFTIPDALFNWICGLPIYFAIILFFLWGIFGMIAEKFDWTSDNQRLDILWEKHLEEE
jgi:hypothetical protein